MDGASQGPPAGVQTTVPCPSCGVAVTVGYPRCPKCHAPVPAPRAKRATAREELLAGGTSIAPEGGGTGRWIALGAVGVAIVAGIAWWAARDDAPAKPAAAPVDDDGEGADREPDDDGPGERPGGAVPAPRRPADPAPAADGAWRAAIRAVDAALRGARLWAKVSRDDDVLVVESSLCEDAGLWPTITGEAEALRAAGAVGVRCVAPHGGVVFERGL